MSTSTTEPGMPEAAEAGSGAPEAAGSRAAAPGPRSGTAADGRSAPAPEAPQPEAAAVYGNGHPRPPSPREERPQRWRPSNLTLRFLTAIVLIPPVLWVCFVGGLPFVAVVVGFIVLAINEFYGFIAAKGARPARLLGTAAAAALPLIMYIGDAFVATSFMTAVLLVVMVLQLTKRDMREAIASVSATFFGVFYVGWLLAHCVSVRVIDRHLVARYGVDADPQLGFFFMLFALAAAVLSDTGAYFIGRRFGRHKLAPEISPNKTIEGALGGLVIGALGAMGMKALFDEVVPGNLAHDLTHVAAAVMGAVVAAVSILGDLVESVLKRDAQVKDAGSLLPGVGGVLDRIDSVLLAIPVLYYMLLGYYQALYG